MIDGLTHRRLERIAQGMDEAHASKHPVGPVQQVAYDGLGPYSEETKVDKAQRAIGDFKVKWICCPRLAGWVVDLDRMIDDSPMAVGEEVDSLPVLPGTVRCDAPDSVHPHVTEHHHKDFGS